MTRISLNAKLFAGLVMITFLAAGCGSDPKPSTPEPKTPAIEEPDEDLVEIPATYYQLPSPNELLNFIKDGGLEFNSEMMSKNENINDIVGRKYQSLAFGRFTAQLAYASSFERFNESLETFSTIKRLADELDISYVFNEMLVDRIQNNIQNADSLELISNTSYFNTITSLEEKDKGDLLALMAAGGWLESMYIVTQSVEYSEGSEAVMRIADQKLTFENLKYYLEQYTDSKDVAEVSQDLNALGGIFEAMGADSETATAITKTEGNNMVLGGSSIVITAEQYNNLKNEIARLHNSITGNV
ncbi:MAG: hypothetical protein ACFB10_10225 [Salibacteraceae bacterium]